MPRQLKLEAESEVPTFTSVIVTRAQIPVDLTPAQKLVLRRNLNLNCEGHAFFFWDCADVRRVLRIGKQLEASDA